MAPESLKKISPLPEVGVLRSSDQKKLESGIVSKLESLGKKLTVREISSLLANINTAKNLVDLRATLASEPKLASTPGLAEEIIAIAQSVRLASKEDLGALRDLVETVQKRSPESIKNSAFLLGQLAIVQKLERSELWDNILLDATWVIVGLVDSVLLIAKFLLELVRDLFLLPRDILTKK